MTHASPDHAAATLDHLAEPAATQEAAVDHAAPALDHPAEPAATQEPSLDHAVPALDHLAELALAQDAFAAAVAEVGGEPPVPWCGRWRTRHLVVHLARIHHWAAAQARGGREVPLGRGPFDIDLLYRTCADELRQTLADLGPDELCSTLLGRGPAAFWRRRQLHETLVHLWDLRTAGGLGISVRAELWADTVDEVVTVMQPRQVALGRMAPLRIGVTLAAEDVDRHWVLGDSSAREQATVRGSAQALALLLWRRPAPGALDLQVDGDRALLDGLLGQALTP